MAKPAKNDANRLALTTINVRSNKASSSKATFQLHQPSQPKQRSTHN
jgi:hypothetical protein